MNKSLVQNNNPNIAVDSIYKNVLNEFNYNIIDIINIKFKNTDKSRAVYKVITDKGSFCLKRVFYDEGNLLFIYSVTEWLNLNNILCPRLVSTKKGHKYISFNDDLYTFTNWIEGRKCDYDKMEDIMSISRTLAKIHRCSYGFKPIIGSSQMDSDHTFYLSLEKHYKQLIEFYYLSKELDDNFSKLYRLSFEYNYCKALESINLIKQLNFLTPLGDNVSMRAICHLDYVNKNIIINEKNIPNIIDFDNTRMDMPAHDICYYLRRILRRERTDWNFDLFCKAINSYNSVRKLSDNELILIYAILSFPTKYWKISHDYFKNYKVCNKYNSYNMLKKTVDYQDSHNLFCTQFRSRIGI